jgi:leucyl aminopeptidase
MKINIHISTPAAGKAQVFFTAPGSDLSKLGLNEAEVAYVSARIDKKASVVAIHQHPQLRWVVQLSDKKSGTAALEAARKAGHTLYQQLKALEVAEVILQNEAHKDAFLAFAEGLALSAYQFNRYKTGERAPKYSLQSIGLHSTNLTEAEVTELSNLLSAVFEARDLVNEPLSFLTAEQLSAEFRRLGAEAGFSVEVFNKKQIESLKMGGLLAVNRGSQRPPTFNILEYKPANALNKQPIVLVGKAVVYDTGGLSLKPTPGSMDSMKCDMAGGAAMGATLYAIAKNKLPIHVVALVPATDNRPGEDAYVPGDVITMYNGMTVEVLNTDAEGRLILADALHYAKKYKPELVIDMATLTGSAVLAIGSVGSVIMGTAADETFKALQNSGEATYERLVHFPFWEEYGDMIKSHIADLKNIGGREAGSITAGKFLEHFVDYPWIHVDIAGPAFLDAESSYRSKHGTGVGVRLLYNFFKNYNHGA